MTMINRSYVSSVFNSSQFPSLVKVGYKQHFCHLDQIINYTQDLAPEYNTGVNLCRKYSQVLISLEDHIIC